MFKKAWILRPNFQNADSVASRRELVPFFPLDLIQSQLTCDLLGHAGDTPTGSYLLWPSCWVLMWEAAEVATVKTSWRANTANSSEGQRRLIRPTKPSLSRRVRCLGKQPAEVYPLPAPGRCCQRNQGSLRQSSISLIIRGVWTCGTRWHSSMRIRKNSDHFSREDFLFTFQS